MIAIGALLTIAGAAASALIEADSVERTYVAFALVTAWAIAAVLLDRDGRRPIAVVTVTGAALGAAAALLSALDAGIAADVAASLIPVAIVAVLVGLPRGEFSEGGRTPIRVAGVLGVLTGAATTVIGEAGDVWVLMAGGAAALAIGGPAANRNYRAATAVDRRRMQWVGWGAAVTTEAALLVLALDLFIDWPDRAQLVAAAATVLVPLAVAASASSKMVTRVDRLLTHTVSLAGLTSLVVGVYLLVVIGLGRSPRDDERALLLLSMAAAAVAAGVYLPARARLETFANRLVYGERVSPDEALRTFGSRMTRAIPLDELLLQLAESLKKSLPLDEVEVWTGSDGTYERVVSLPHRDVVFMHVGQKERPVVARAGVTGGTWLEIWLKDLVRERDVTRMRVASLAHAGELLGLIVLVRRPGTDPLTEEQDDMLAELARQVGLALHNVQLDSALQASLEEVQRKAEELQESRLRIVTAGDAERRRLERDLHDGAQQQLVALSVKVNLARTLLQDNPEVAMQMLDELKGDVADAVQELRNLAHGIFPPLLMSGGLSSALPAAATRSPLPASVDIAGVRRYAQAVESTVYFCCLEAMQNAGKHAGEGATVDVRAWEENDGELLCFEVADNGAGFDLSEDTVRGHGFVNMADRLGAIGGELVVWSSPGQGARIGGRIPLTEELLQTTS